MVITSQVQLASGISRGVLSVRCTAVDAKAPELSLHGEERMSVLAGSEFQDPCALSTTSMGSDIESCDFRQG